MRITWCDRFLSNCHFAQHAPASLKHTQKVTRERLRFGRAHHVLSHPVARCPINSAIGGGKVFVRQPRPMPPTKQWIHLSLARSQRIFFNFIPVVAAPINLHHIFTSRFRLSVAWPSVKNRNCAQAHSIEGAASVCGPVLDDTVAADCSPKLKRNMRERAWAL